MLTKREFVGATLLAPLASLMTSWPSRAAPSPDSSDMAGFIAQMPKSEFHLHLEGTLEAEMKFELARRNGLTLPYADVAAMKQSYIYNDLPSFLKIYYEGNSVLLKEQDFYDLCYAYLAKAASQNIIYAEMFFDPQSHTSRNIGLDIVIGGIARAQADAQSKLGIESQLILCFMRDLSAESAMAALEAALPFKRYLVGVGLDSDEKGNPPGKFAAVFARARAAGLKVTAHCDLNQQDTIANIRQAIEEIAVDRIDHGGNILESPELMQIARNRNMFFTVCPSFSGVVKADGRQFDVVRGMLDNGLNVTINTDDPAYMGSEYINEVLIRTQKQSKLTKQELLQIERNGFNAAWITPVRRDAFLARLESFAKSSGVGI